MFRVNRPILFILLLLTYGAEGQNLTQSPYSVVGVGEIHFAGTAQLMGLGQTAQAYRRPFEINVLNPASYSSMQQTVFEASFLYTSGTISNATATSGFDNATFSSFVFGVPLSVKRGIALVAGVMPYSAVGYNLSTSKVYPGVPDYTGTTQLQGRGGLTRFMAGTGVRISNSLSAGIQVNYLFGKITSSQQLVFDRSLNKFNISEERVQVMQDFQYELGLQYHHSLNDLYKISGGLTFIPSASLDAKYSFTNRTLGWGGSAMYTVDTIEHYENQGGETLLPQTIRTGIALERKGVWLLSADMNYTNWAAFRAFGLSDNLKNNLGMSLGASWIPDAQASKSLMKRMEYRAGLRFDNGNIEINGSSVNCVGLSAGLGVPMGKTKSRLNIGLEYLSRGSTQNGLLKEELVRIMLGITFSDQWFVRYKYD